MNNSQRSSRCRLNIYRWLPFSQHLNNLKKCCEKWETALKNGKYRFFYDRTFLLQFVITEYYRIENVRVIIYSWKIWCLSHIGARSGQGVSMILVSTVSFASQSYHWKLLFKRLNPISLMDRPCFSVISVSRLDWFGAVILYYIMVWYSNITNILWLVPLPL